MAGRARSLVAPAVGAAEHDPQHARPDKSEPADHYVAADHDTVWLVREHVDVDVELFLRETAEGRRLLATGEPAKAEALLTQADGSLPRRVLRRRPVRRLDRRAARAGPAHVRRGRRPRSPRSPTSGAIRRGRPPPPAHPRRRPVRRGRPPRPDPVALRPAPPRRGPPRLPQLLHPPRRARRRPGPVPALSASSPEQFLNTLRKGCEQDRRPVAYSSDDGGCQGGADLGERVGTARARRPVPAGGAADRGRAAGGAGRRHARRLGLASSDAPTVAPMPGSRWSTTSTRSPPARRRHRGGRDDQAVRQPPRRRPRRVRAGARRPRRRPARSRSTAGGRARWRRRRPRSSASTPSRCCRPTARGPAWSTATPSSSSATAATTRSRAGAT